MSERTELDEFLRELEVEDYKGSTIEAFGATGHAMIDAGVIYVVDHLKAIKSAMRDEYGD